MERSRRRQRVSFRHATLEDLRAVGGLVSDPDADVAFDQHRALKRAVVFLVEHSPAAVFGITRKWPTEASVGQVWSYIDRTQFRGNHANTRRLVELCKALIDWSHGEFGYTRIEASINADDELALEFARVLGFHEESSRMKHAGPGGMDLVTVARLWESV